MITRKITTCSKHLLVLSFSYIFICSFSLEFICGSNRYSILAPNAIPSGFVDGKVVTEKVLLALQLDLNEYRLGHTKVFFRAGVLGLLEDLRDERLSKIISNFQARIRGYLIRKSYKRLEEQRSEANYLILNSNYYIINYLMGPSLTRNIVFLSQRVWFRCEYFSQYDK